MPPTLQLSLSEYDSMVRVGAFDQIAQKVELIRGELVAKNPAGPLHDDLVTYLTDWSADHRDRTKSIITSQTGLNLPELVSRPEPDVLWLRKDRYRDAHPSASDVQLAIEVSQSSLAYDLEQNRMLYASAGIVEYWIVDAMSRCIHVLTNPVQGDYSARQIFKIGETLAPQIAPNAKLNLTDLFN